MAEEGPTEEVPLTEEVLPTEVLLVEEVTLVFRAMDVLNINNKEEEVAPLDMETLQEGHRATQVQQVKFNYLA